MKEFEETKNNDTDDNSYTKESKLNDNLDENLFDESQDTFDGIDSFESNTLFSSEFESHKTELFSNDINSEDEKTVEKKSTEQKKSNLPDFYTDEIRKAIHFDSDFQETQTFDTTRTFEDSQISKNSENIQISENKTDLSVISPDEFADDPTAKKKKRKKKFLTEGDIFTFLIVFAVIFTSFIYLFYYTLHPIKVVGVSMQPTLNSKSYYLGDHDETHCDIVYYSKQKSYSTNDIVIVANNDYKYIPFIKYLDTDRQVKSFIKRVVATEHQTIQFILDDEEVVNSVTRYYYTIEVFDKDGKNVNLDQSYLDERMYFTESDLFNNGQEFYLYYLIFSNVKQNMEYSITISEDCYFVMGDNRNNSTDSRFFGEIHYEDISGSVQLIVAYNSNILQAIWVKIKSYI